MNKSRLYKSADVKLVCIHLENVFYMTYGQSMNDVQEPITSAPPEVRQIIERVLQAEKDKLYMKVPRNINDDILKIIKEEVQ